MATGLPAKTHLIVIGASTGGVQALNKLFAGLKPPMPPIMIVQHIQEAFAAKFAERLDRDCELSVRIAKHGERIANNTVYIAPAEYHLEVKRMPVVPVCYVQESTPVMNHLPSVEMLMMSVAAAELAEGAIGIMLTGMGNDGSTGLLAMRNAGAYTIGENEDSCVVYGMPRAALQCGGVMVELGLEHIRQCLEYVQPVN